MNIVDFFNHIINSFSWNEINKKFPAGKGIYKIWEIDLSEERTNEKYDFHGNCLSVIKCPHDAYVRFNDVDNDAILLTEIKLMKTSFKEFYITNSATSGILKIITGSDGLFLGIPKTEYYDVLELHTFPNAVILSDTTLRNSELVPFPAITFNSPPNAIYMDVVFPNIRNVNAGANHSNGFRLQVKHNGSWYDCIIVPDPSLWLSGSQVAHGDITFCGTTDIKDYIPSDTVIYPRLYQHSTDDDAYYFYDVYCRLRLYFGG